MKLRAATALATPVRSSRQWTTALSPRTAGGWDFIAHSYVLDSSDPSEWIVVNLDDGTATVTEASTKVYSNSNFQVASANTTSSSTNQLRAPGGRIFFPEAAGNIGVDVTDQHYVNVAYYDPGDRQMHQLPSIESPSGATRHAIAYSAIFDASGSYLYLGTQSVVGDLPFVFRIDPEALGVSVIGTVGTIAGANPKYAYYLAKDEGPGAQWLYVAVGQDTWELVKINVLTGAQTVLYTTTGPGLQFMQFDDMPNGWRVVIYDDGVPTYYWIADGALEAYPGGGAPSGGARTVTPYAGTLTGPPQIDHSRGIGQVLWRANGSSGDWTRVTYDVSYTSEINIESTLALSDGTVLGNTEQYQGFFRYNPATNTADWYGNWTAGLSQPVLLEVGEVVYMCGYPNSALYAYDPTATWLIGTNPVSLGSYFAAVGTKYAYHLAHESGRLYMLGRKERDSLGSGIGYYDTSAGTFAGTSTDLDNYNPRGLVILPDIQRVIISGRSLDGTGGVIVAYDYDLTEIDRWTLDWSDAGAICSVDGRTITGISSTNQRAYRFDVSRGEVLQSVTLDDTLGAYAQVDGEILVMIDSTLKTLDPLSLRLSDASKNPPALASIIAPSTGPVVYAASGATLYQQSKITGASGRRRRRRPWWWLLP